MTAVDIVKFLSTLVLIVCLTTMNAMKRSPLKRRQTFLEEARSSEDRAVSGDMRMCAFNKIIYNKQDSREQAFARLQLANGKGCLDKKPSPEIALKLLTPILDMSVSKSIKKQALACIWRIKKQAAK